MLSLDASLHKLVRDGDDDPKKAATALESYFLRQVLTEVRKSSGGTLDGGFAGETFREMLDEAMADSMANAGGMGMAKVLEKQLDPESKATPLQALEKRSNR